MSSSKSICAWASGAPGVPGLPQVYFRLDLMDTLIIMTYWPNDHTDAGGRHGSLDNGDREVLCLRRSSCAHGAHGPRQYPKARFSAET